MARQQSRQLFAHYYARWIRLYKEGAVRPVTLRKYEKVLDYIKELAPDVHLNELNRATYQAILNKYALSHERQTVLDFHHHLRAAIMDAVDDELIRHDPTRRAVIKGCAPKLKKSKFLNLYELQLLLRRLELGSSVSWDWFILLVAKTGLRFAEALALTPEDINVEEQTINIRRSWNYKNPSGGFQKTKNASSVRKVATDWKLIHQLASLCEGIPRDQPIFVPDGKRVFNSTVNDLLEKYCTEIGIPVISIHGLRHTHASLLLYEGVSIPSVSQRLGHANTTTTEKTYLHIIQELENQDRDKVMRHLSQL